MRGNRSIGRQGTTLYQILRSRDIRCLAALRPLLAIALMAAALAALSACSESEPDGTRVLAIPLRMGLAKDNGATPWYGELAIGGESQADADSAGQLLKFLMDTGTASTWATSRECDTIPCRHHRRYDPGERINPVAGSAASRRIGR